MDIIDKFGLPGKCKGVVLSSFDITKDHMLIYEVDFVQQKVRRGEELIDK